MDKASRSGSLEKSIHKTIYAAVLRKVKVLHSIYQQTWKTQQGHRTGKGQFSFQSQRKTMPKNSQTTAQLHSSHNSNVMLKILQARLQQYMNHELPDAQATIQLRSLHMLAQLWLKSFKLGFSSTSMKNFQMYKLDLENTEKPVIKLSTFVWSYKKQENSRKAFASLITQNLWLCGSQQSVENS